MTCPISDGSPVYEGHTQYQWSGNPFALHRRLRSGFTSPPSPPLHRPSIDHVAATRASSSRRLRTTRPYIPPRPRESQLPARASQRAALFVIAPLLCCPGARESSVRSTILGQNRLTPAPRSAILDAHPACAPLLPVYSPHTPLSSPSPIPNDTLLCPGRFQHDHDH